MIQATQDLKNSLLTALQRLGASNAENLAIFETPKQAAHGDLAITSAMTLAKSLKKNPREAAQQLMEFLQADPVVQQWVETLEMAGPGFINLRLKPSARQAIIGEILAQGDAYGRLAPQGRKLMVEFVSANPTGPLHVGHGRQAALGDAICHLYESQGWDVTREFYYNDAGVQIGTLASSTQARLKGVKPGDAEWPEAAYNGDYIAEIAEDFKHRKTVSADDREFTASGDVEDIDSIRQFAVAYLRHEQDLDLQAFSVKFDNYFLESSLYANGQVESTVQRLIDAGKTYEEGGALWLRTTEYGDDKDRVMKKSDGTYTYFVPDVAYHINKWGRGFDKVVNIQGSDHHGTIARVRAGLQAANVGVPQGWPDYVLHKMVTVMRGGEEVKISKRAGSYVTLRDLIDWTGKDAVRFFLISRKADTEFVFDVDLALKKNDENPVYYVQYAHARIHSVQKNFADTFGAEALSQSADVSLLTAPSEYALMMKLAHYPNMVTNAALNLAPHDVAFYLRDVASALHSYYNAERFIVEGDLALSRARLSLLQATAQVLRSGLALLGVSAPEKM